jgi:MOSC domain-containing protein YiiM
MAGRLIGIARREKSRAPMEMLHSAEISTEAGLVGDCKGIKFPLRQITLLQRELWEAALFTLGNPDLDWTARRANLLVEGVNLPRGIGSEITVGDVILEVTAQTSPCAQMDHAWQGLRRALAPDWRGGVTTRVLTGGMISIGDEVRVTREVPERKVHLPG